MYLQTYDTVLWIYLYIYTSLMLPKKFAACSPDVVRAVHCLRERRQSQSYMSSLGVGV